MWLKEGGSLMRKNSLIHSSMQGKSNTACDSFHGTIEFIGKRWTGIIVYYLLDGPKRYYELLAAIEGISDRLLTERLRELETHRIVVKHVAESPSRIVTYELTEMGQDLEGVMNSIIQWVKKHGCHANSDEQ